MLQEMLPLLEEFRDLMVVEEMVDQVVYQPEEPEEPLVL
jgi:hypothetical protein